MSYLHTRNLRCWRRARQYIPLTADELDQLFLSVCQARQHNPPPVCADRVTTPWLHFLRRKAKQP